MVSHEICPVPSARAAHMVSILVPYPDRASSPLLRFRVGSSHAVGSLHRLLTPDSKPVEPFPDGTVRCFISYRLGRRALSVRLFSKVSRSATALTVLVQYGYSE